jgi:hypothetical protein
MASEEEIKQKVLQASEEALRAERRMRHGMKVALTNGQGFSVEFLQAFYRARELRRCWRVAYRALEETPPSLAVAQAREWVRSRLASFAAHTGDHEGFKQGIVEASAEAGLEFLDETAEL